MRRIGIDFGTKRTGIALSDEGGRIAFPHSVLPTEKKLPDEIVALAKESGVTTFILGRSITGGGEENPVMIPMKALAKKLKEYGEVIFEDERYTSQQAARTQGNHNLHDASSAALILQNYLDRINKVSIFDDPYTISSD
jgi:putative Holliday junction resolvase